VDFKRLNDGSVHFSVGAVNVMTGNFLFFDNRKEEIRLEHVLASRRCRRPFPWCRSAPIISGTAASSPTRRLQHLLAQDDDINSLVFQVDLFSARGDAPHHVGRAGPAQGHHVFLAHPPGDRQFRPPAAGNSAPMRALIKVPEAN
jgi:NTE family protein